MVELTKSRFEMMIAATEDMLKRNPPLLLPLQLIAQNPLRSLVEDGWGNQRLIELFVVASSLILVPRVTLMVRFCFRNLFAQGFQACLVLSSFRL
jgi:hypothetical protein